MTIAANIDTKSVDKWLSTAEKKLLPRIESQAINEAARTVRTDSAKKIRDVMSIKAKGTSPKFGSDGGGLVVIKRASPKSLFATIEGNKRTTPLSKTFFSVSERKATKSKRSSTSIKLKGRRVVFRNTKLGTAGGISARGRYKGGTFDFDDDLESQSRTSRLKTFSIRSQLTKPYITNTLDQVTFKAFKKAFLRGAKRQGLIS